MNPHDVDEYPNVRMSVFDPPPELVTYREQDPIRRMRYPDGHIGWLVTSHKLARSLLADTRFSADSAFKRPPVTRPGLEPYFGEPALPGWLLDLDPPQHTRIRQQVTGKFTARRMREMRPGLEKIAESLLDDVEAGGPSADLLANFTLPLSTQAICELLGVPYSERADFQRDSKALFSLDSTPSDASNAMDRLYALVGELAKPAPGRDGLLNLLAMDGTLDHDEITGVGVMMLTGGHGSTSMAIAMGIFALLSHPEQLDRLKNDWSLLDNAVEELLRFVTIFHFGVPRSAKVDMEFGGQFLKAGEAVTVSLPAANRDPDWFQGSPDKLDITRKTAGHLSFGHGIHQCTGQSLVRVEMRVALTTLFTRFPHLALAVPTDEVPYSTDTSPVYGVHQLPVTW